MHPGRTMYKRLKATLDMEDSSLTVFSAELSTNIPQLKWVVLRYAATNEIPTDENHLKIMAAVTAKLSQHNPLWPYADVPQ